MWYDSRMGRTTGIDYARLAREGQRLAYDRALDPMSHGDCMWALTIDAASVWARRPSSGGPRAKLSFWPDTHTEAQERWRVELEWEVDGIRPETRVHVTPSPRELDRSEEVLQLWEVRRVAHMVRGDPQRAVKALWLYAGGSTPQRVKTLTGVTRATLHERRTRFCAALGEPLREYLGTAA